MSKLKNKTEEKVAKYNLDIYFSQGDAGLRPFFYDIYSKMQELEYNYDLIFAPWITIDRLILQILDNWTHYNKADRYHHFLVWWTEVFIDEYGFLIFNAAFEKFRKEMKDQEAEKKANEVTSLFKGMFIAG